MKISPDPRLVDRLTEIYIDIIKTKPIANLTGFVNVACLLIGRTRFQHDRPIVDKLYTLIPQMSEKHLSRIVTYLVESSANPEFWANPVIQRAFQLLSIMEMNASMDHIPLRKILYLFQVYNSCSIDMDPNQIEKVVMLQCTFHFTTIFLLCCITNFVSAE